MVEHGSIGGLRRVVFVAGSNHSGSTLTGCALGASPDPFRDLHLGECYAWFRPEAKDAHAPDFWRGVAHDTDRRAAYAAIVERSGAETLIDSSKNLRWLRDQAQVCRAAGVELTLLVTHRPMADVYRSVLKRVSGEPQVRKRMGYYRRLAEQLPGVAPDRLVFVDTAAFLAAPAQRLEALCADVRIPYFAGKERYWEFDHHHVYGALRQRRQIAGAEPGGYAAPPPPTEDERREAAAYLGANDIGEARDVIGRAWRAMHPQPDHAA